MKALLMKTGSALALVTVLAATSCSKKDSPAAPAAPAAQVTGNIPRPVSAGNPSQNINLRIQQLEERLHTMESSKDAAPKSVEGLRAYIAALKRFQAGAQASQAHLKAQAANAGGSASTANAAGTTSAATASSSGSSAAPGNSSGTTAKK